MMTNENILASMHGPSIWGCNMYTETLEMETPNGLDCSGFVTWALFILRTVSCEKRKETKNTITPGQIRIIKNLWRSNKMKVMTRNRVKVAADPSLIIDLFTLIHPKNDINGQVIKSLKQGSLRAEDWENVEYEHLPKLLQDRSFYPMVRAEL